MSWQSGIYRSPLPEPENYLTVLTCTLTCPRRPKSRECHISQHHLIPTQLAGAWIVSLFLIRPVDRYFSFFVIRPPRPDRWIILTLWKVRNTAIFINPSFLFSESSEIAHRTRKVQGNIHTWTLPVSISGIPFSLPGQR